jgi:hypothetical protein
MLGGPRLHYPDNHIEVDNRLSWMLGRLGEAYGAAAFYVHLKRQEDGVVESICRRIGDRFDKMELDVARRQGIVVAHKLVLMGAPGASVADLARDYVRTVDANIAAFLASMPRKMEFRLEEARADFPRFWGAIVAEGDLAAATAEWETRYNSGEAREAREKSRDVSGKQVSGLRRFAERFVRR